MYQNFELPRLRIDTELNPNDQASFMKALALGQRQVIRVDRIKLELSLIYKVRVQKYPIDAGAREVILIWGKEKESSSYNRCFDGSRGSLTRGSFIDQQPFEPFCLIFVPTLSRIVHLHIAANLAVCFPFLN